MKLLRNDIFLAFALALCVFAAYLATLSPAVGPEDAGELAAVATTLGVAHPTGYPLFSLLGRVFSILPLGDLRVIVKLNLMGAVLCAVAAGLFYHLFLFLLREKPFGRVPSGKKLPLPETTPVQRLAAVVGTLVFAFSRVYWANAVAVEVYALHLVFLALVLLLFARSVRAHVEREAAAGRWWLLFAYALGLSFSNHMMTVLLAPALLYLYFSTHGFARSSWLKMARGLPAFLIGLTPYLYLPIRASLRPVMNWGDPSTWENFRYHVSAGQFRFKMFASGSGALEKLVEFLADLPAAVGYAALALAALGAWRLAHRERRLGAAVLLVFVTGVVYEVNYGFDDPNFRLNAHAALALAAAAGFLAVITGLAERAGKGSRLPVVLAALGAACVGFAAFAGNFRASDRSGDYTVEDYARNVMASLDSSAIVFSDDGPGFVAAADYLRDIEGLRTDAIAINGLLLVFPWYHASLEARRPGLLAGSERASREFFTADSLEKIATAGGSPRDPAMQVRFTGMLREIMQANAARHPLFVAYDITQNLPSDEVLGYPIEPSGLSFRLVTTPDARPPATTDFAFHPLPGEDSLARRVAGLYAMAYVNQGIGALIRGDTATARDRMDRALGVQPENSSARAWRMRLQ